jgi:glutamate dehydrogenase
VYAGVMPRHPLRREITATHVVNSMVNRVGSTFVHRLMESTGAKPAEIVRAYLLTREVFAFVPLWQSIEALDGSVPDAAQAEMLIEGGRLVVRATNWFLRSARLGAPMEPTIDHFRPGIEAIYGRLGELVDAPAAAHIDALAGAWAQAGVPREVAHRVASLDTLFAALDIAEVSAGTGRTAEAVATAYFGVTAKLGLAWLRDRIGALPGDGHWQALAKSAMRDDLAGLQRSLAMNALAASRDGEADPVAAWAAQHGAALERAARILGELRAVPSPDLAMLSVALRELRNLA